MNRKRISDKDTVLVVLIVIVTIYTIIRKDMFAGGFSKEIVLNYLYGLIPVLIGVFVILLIAKILYNKRKNSKYLKYDFNRIDRMDGIEFEALLAEYFKLNGYHVVMTPASNDYGADLVLGKGGDVIIVQAKRYKNKVGNSAVQEIVAAMPYYKATKAMVVTNSYYTKNAKELAKANNVILWDRNDMKNIFHIIEKEDKK